MNRTLVIGDIHGQFDELVKVLEFSCYRADDQLVFLGDYIDYGSKSREVIEFLIDCKKANPSNIFLRGNHEDMLLNIVHGEISFWNAWMEDAKGETFLLSYGIDKEAMKKIIDWNSGMDSIDMPDSADRIFTKIPSVHLEFLEHTSSYYETENFFFSHAGVAKGIKLNKQTFGALVWGDNRCLNDNTDYGKMLIFGHWHNDVPIIGYRRIGIARKNDVAVLDLSNMVITDSKGNTRQLG